MTKEQILEQVRVNLLRHLENHPAASMSAMARTTGYSYHAVQKYALGELMTVPVAAALVRNYPEIGQGVTCKHCGHLLFS